jgi:hypothetical protein
MRVTCFYVPMHGGDSMTLLTECAEPRWDGPECKYLGLAWMAADELPSGRKHSRNPTVRS